MNNEQTKQFYVEKLKESFEIVGEIRTNILREI